MKGIKKAFSGVEVLKGIDLSCAEGEVLGIIGPSGSGKSTLLRIATFLETADRFPIMEGQWESREKRRIYRKPRHSSDSFFRISISSRIGLFWKMLRMR